MTALRHAAGYALIGFMVLRGEADLSTLGMACLVILVFGLPGVAKLYSLARHYVSRHDPRPPGD